jgi:hypothetical protein
LLQFNQLRHFSSPSDERQGRRPWRSTFNLRQLGNEEFSSKFALTDVGESIQVENNEAVALQPFYWALPTWLTEAHAYPHDRRLRS